MFKKLLLLILCLFFLSCTNNAPLDKTLIRYKEKSVSQSEFIKSLLHNGFLLYGKNLILDIKDPRVFKELRQKALEIELENLFIQNKADVEGVIIKDGELNAWIEKRTKGLISSELEYFLNYSNMTLKEWKALFKDQLLKEKVLKLYSNSDNKSEGVTNDTGAASEAIKHYQVATLTFDSTVEAQNIYKELKAFPKRLDDLLMQKKGTKSYDWITAKDEVIYDKVKNLRQGGLSKPFETPWGHMIIKFFKSDERSSKRPQLELDDKTAASAEYLKDLMAFKAHKELNVNIRSIDGLKLK